MTTVKICDGCCVQTEEVVGRYGIFPISGDKATNETIAVIVSDLCETCLDRAVRKFSKVNRLKTRNPKGTVTASIRRIVDSLPEPFTSADVRLELLKLIKTPVYLASVSNRLSRLARKHVLVISSHGSSSVPHKYRRVKDKDQCQS